LAEAAAAKTERHVVYRLVGSEDVTGILIEKMEIARAMRRRKKRCARPNDALTRGKASIARFTDYPNARKMN